MQADARQRRAANQRRYRRHLKAGVMVVGVEVDAAIVRMLIATHWLKLERNEEVVSKAKIKAAIEGLLQEAAQG